MSETVILQQRHGQYEDFDPQKTKPAEFHVVQGGDPNTTDGKSVYIGFEAGSVKRLATADEMGDANDRAEAILSAVQEAQQDINEKASTATTKAREAAQSAQDAEDAKNSVAQTIRDNIDDAKAEIDQHAQTAVDGIDAEYEARKGEIDAKIDQIVAVKTNAEQIATDALNKANNLEILKS